MKFWPIFNGAAERTGHVGGAFYLCDRQYGHRQHERDGPGDQVEVGGLPGQGLVGGAQRLEGGVPGVGEHHEPDHPRHQGIVHDDEDDDAGQRFRGAGGTDRRTRRHTL